MKKAATQFLFTLGVYGLLCAMHIVAASAGEPPGLVAMTGHAFQINAVAVSPDGLLALSASGDGLRLWEIESGRELRTISGVGRGFNSVAICADGKTALSGGVDKTLRVWNLFNGRELRILSGHTGAVTSVAFSPDCKTAISGSWDNTVRLWEVESGRELHTKWA